MIALSTRDKIIDASIKNFLIFGYDNTSLSTIAAEVGIKKPSIYYHFKNKEDLFIVSVNHIFDSLENYVSDSIKNVSSSYEILENIFLSLIDFNKNLSYIVGNNHSEPVNLYNLFHFGKNKYVCIRERIDKYYNYLRSTIMDIIKMGQKNKEIRKDLDKELLALQIISWIEGFFALSSIYSYFDIYDMYQSLYDNMWKMITTQTKPKKGFFNRKANPKTISLGTKW
ncbi:MAG: hypothetical protein PWQ37_1796 [Candidatus Petromonas sp.]|nr:hypothetical protein [Candidatus Petromonas sp.]